MKLILTIETYYGKETVEIIIDKNYYNSLEDSAKNSYLEAEARAEFFERCNYGYELIED